ncbi:hypothetical protein [Rubinisphaera margarita]|uniref:hypothetical protein n=1 Tax=Rubinisphaera margarita TaxID=2909586 RepID=UPI001EE84B60|nr:hypothetical protein [Rubinisphaera margarita]MCG6157064.1 hypothetical protein [Rubinisphaera margarita]
MSTNSHDNKSRSNGPGLTTVLLIVFCVELIAIAGMTYSQVQENLEPENIAAATEQYAEENYPEIRKEIVTRVRENSDQYAETVSQQLMASSDDARIQLEQLTETGVEEGLDEGTQMSKQAFREFLKENHQEIESYLKELEDSPQEARQFIVGLEQDLEQALEVDMQKQMDNLAELQTQFNSKVDRLTAGGNMEPIELLELRILRLMKTLQQQNQNAVATTE